MSLPCLININFSVLLIYSRLYVFKTSNAYVYNVEFHFGNLNCGSIHGYMPHQYTCTWVYCIALNNSMYILWFQRYCYFQKRPNFPFWPWTMVIKNLIDWNQPKKFMQVGIDATCMHTNCDGHSSSGFGDIATFKNSQISPSVHGHQKI